MKRSEWVLIGIVIGAGIFLRMVDISIPDVLTDEAQFGLGASAAHPPLGMFLMRVVMMLFDMNIIALRSLSIVLGIGCVALIYCIAREKFSRDVALYAAGIASLFPAAILFSRLAFLTIPQLFFWLLTLLLFLRAKRHSSSWSPLFLFLVAVCATFVKFQGLAVPAFLLLGRIIEMRERSMRDDIAQILFLSLVPITFYDATHPGVAASVFLYGGADDMPDVIDRLMLLVRMWWDVLGLAIVLLPLSLLALQKIGWELQLMFFFVLLQGFFLGPTHEYYAADLMMCAIPCGILMTMGTRWMRISGIIALLVIVVALLGPRTLFRSTFTETLYQREGYWNTHSDAINAALKDQDDVIVLGTSAGHQLRWYLKPKVLVGKDMDLAHTTGAFLLLDPSIQTPFDISKEIYNDEQVRVVLR